MTSLKVGKTFKAGDHIGILIDYSTGTLTFSREKEEVKTVKLEPNLLSKDMYPCVGFHYAKGAVVCLGAYILSLQYGN